MDVDTFDAAALYMLGDADRDGDVDFNDTLCVLANFNASYDVCDYRACASLGDANLDGTVNFSDVLSVSANNPTPACPDE